MKKTISIIISIAMCAMLASCGGVKNEVSDTEQPTLIDTMSLEEKVGQILFVRCVEDGQTDDLMSIKPGGILMFGRDFEGLTKDEVKEKIHSMPISPVRFTCGAQHAHTSYPGTVTILTCPSISILLLYSSCASSSLDGYVTSIGIFFEMATFTSCSTSAISSGEITPLKSIVTTESLR